MKILYFSPHPNLILHSPSGPGTHMREVIRALELDGHTVVRFIAGGENWTESQTIAYANPWYKRIAKFVLPELVWQSAKDWALLRFDRRMKKKLDALIRDEKPDVIYERGYYLMRSGIRCAIRHSLPHIIEINAPYPEEKTALEGRSLYLRRAARTEHEQIARAHRIVVVSSALKEYYGKKYPRSADKLIVTPNAIDPSQAIANDEDVRALRRFMGIGPTDLVIGFVGSIFRYHGVDILLDAFGEWKRRRPDIGAHLVIVGDGIVLPELMQASRRAGLGPLVHFAGNVPHGKVYTYIAAMDVAVMASSNWYGSPVKVFEYGAMKKAVIAPDNIPLKDVMVDGIDGLLVKGNKTDVANALQRLMEDAGLRERLATSFHQKVVTHFTWAQVGQTIGRHFQNLLLEKNRVHELDITWNKKLLVVRSDFSHHGDHSGYKQILRFLSPRFVLGLREGEEDLNPRIKARYQWLFEWDIRRYLPDVDLIHIMYAEDYLRFSTLLYRRIPVVATFHQPEVMLEAEIMRGALRGRLGQITHWITRSRFRRLAAAIVTENSQKKILSRVMPTEKIHVIPLGVHLDRFRQSFHSFEESGKRPIPGQIITVGNWLRDWEFYLQTLGWCEENRPGWKFHLVNRKIGDSMKSELARFSNVSVHQELSDEALMELLFTSRVHYLPVTGASGNNALMEGLAMGCPAVMTDVVSEEFPLRSSSLLVYRKSDLADAIKKLDAYLTLPEDRYAAIKAGTFALSADYDWKEIARRTLGVYQQTIR